MPMVRFTHRLTEAFNVRVKTLIKIKPTNNDDITNNNLGVAAIDPVFASKDFRTFESLSGMYPHLSRLTFQLPKATQG